MHKTGEGPREYKIIVWMLGPKLWNIMNISVLNIELSTEVDIN